jgi:hypothetical protein
MLQLQMQSLHHGLACLIMRDMPLRLTEVIMYCSNGCKSAYLLLLLLLLLRLNRLLLLLW